MKRVFIVGGNGFARECYYMLKLSKRGYAASDFEFGGFLGHGGYGHTVNYKEYQHLYKGEVSDFSFCEDDYIIIGAGYPHLRKKIYDDVKKLGLKFFTLSVDGTEFASSVKYGEANIFGSPFRITVDINIGTGNVFNGGIVVGHDAEIGDFNFFGPSSQILGTVKVGDMNQIGANSILLPNSKLGNNNKIAPLSAVYKGCKDCGYYMGNPAVKIGSNLS